MSYMIQATLSNAKHRQNGSNEILFPLGQRNYADVIQRLAELGAGDAIAQDCRVEEISSPYEEFQCLKGQVVNVDELDYLAKRLDSFDAYERLQFQTVCSAFRVTDIQTLINLTFCCQRVTVISDFSKLEEVGKAHYLATHRGSVPTEELGKINGKAIAEKLIRSRTGRPTTYGLFFHNEMSIEKLYRGKGFPSCLWDQRQAELDFTKPDGTTAVIFLPFTELELERFLQREDIPDIKACKRTLLLFQSKERNFALEGRKAELDEWNEFCDTLNIMSEHHRQVFAAALEVVGAEELSQLELLATNIDDFDLIPGIKDAKSYGRYMIQESGKYDYDESLDCYYNYEALGEFLLAHEIGQMTKQGYLKCEEGSAFLDFFVQASPEQGQAQGEQSMQMGEM